MRNMSRMLLGVAYPLAVTGTGLGPLWVGYGNLPGEIAVHFDVTRTPTTALSKPILSFMLAALLLVSVSACVFVARQTMPARSTRLLQLAGAGGFFSAVAACLSVLVVTIHKDLADWHDATGPGWWLLLVILFGFAGSAGAQILARKI